MVPIFTIKTFFYHYQVKKEENEELSNENAMLKAKEKQVDDLIELIRETNEVE